MSGRWLAIGAWLCAMAIAAGAFGAHSLAERLDERGLALWETAARYFMYAGLGLLGIGLAARQTPSRAYHRAAWALLGGAVIFSGTVAVLALGGPRWLGAVTPIGGVSMIAGFVVFGAAALRS